MKKRLMLPVMAFVFAIGLSFATERSTADTQNDWVDVGGPDRMKIEEVDCGIPAEVCTGRFEKDGLVYEIYDSEESTEPKQGAGELKDFLIPVPN